MLINALRNTHSQVMTHIPDARPGLQLVAQRPAAPQIIIEPVTDSYTAAAAAYVREEVFEREWKIRVPRLPRWAVGEMLTLVARVESRSEPVAALTVMETTTDHGLHQRFGLTFPEQTRIARYTQLAVLAPYRGLKIPLQLVIEARRRFVVPEGIDYTWLLFDAEHARASSFCKQLDFRAGAEVFETEYGRSRVLIRNERFVSPKGECTLERLTPDEWVAQ
jgi:hypothetical protein